MTWIDDVLKFLSDAPVAFLVGALVGFGLSNRYRVVKRNGKGTDDDASS